MSLNNVFEPLLKYISKVFSFGWNVLICVSTSLISNSVSVSLSSFNISFSLKVLSILLNSFKISSLTLLNLLCFLICVLIALIIVSGVDILVFKYLFIKLLSNPIDFK